MKLYKFHEFNNNIYQVNTTSKKCILEDEFKDQYFKKL